MELRDRLFEHKVLQLKNYEDLSLQSKGDGAAELDRETYEKLKLKLMNDIGSSSTSSAPVNAGPPSLRRAPVTSGASTAQNSHRSQGGAAGGGQAATGSSTSPPPRLQPERGPSKIFVIKGDELRPYHRFEKKFMAIFNETV